MTSPTLEDETTTTVSSPTPTPSIDLPATVDADDHLIVAAGWNLWDGDLALTSSGWETLYRTNLHGYHSVWVLALLADGTEDGGTIDWASNGPWAIGGGVVQRWSGGYPGGKGVALAVAALTARGYGTAPDPPALAAPWGSADNAWIAISSSGNTGATVTAPSGYSTAAASGAGGDVVSAMAYLAAAAASEDPGAFTLSTPENYWAVTVALRPADATVSATVVTAFDAGAATTGALAGGTASWSFTDPGGQQVATAVEVLVDWDNNGVFTEPEETITAYVVDLQIDRGKDYASQLTGRAIRGRLRAILKNGDNRFNRSAGGPLTVAPFGLRQGRKVRAQISEVTDRPEPVRITYDRFGTSGTVVQTETAEPWAMVGAGGEWTAGNGAVSCDGDGTLVVDARVTEGYFQATWDHVDDSVVSIVYRWLDDDNYGAVTLDGTTLSHVDVTSGSPTTHGSVTVENRPRITIGVLVSAADDVTVYVEGVEAFTDLGDAHDGDGNAVGTGWGIDTVYGSQRPAACAEIGLWDRLWAQVEGVLFTGDLVELSPWVDEGPQARWATLEAEGWLARLAVDNVTPPESIGQTTASTAGVTTGQMVGATLREVGLLHPPPPGGLGEGITLGSVGTGKAQGIYLAQLFETAELGSLLESPEGPIIFLDRDDRAARQVRAALSDLPGSQFSPMTPLAVVDWRRDTANQATAEISPVAPEIVDTDTVTGNHAGGATATITVTIPSGPTAADGDLMVVLVTPACQLADEPIEAPSGWTRLGGGGGDTAQGHEHWFARRLTTASLGDSVTFYGASTTGGGSWIATYWVVAAASWYGAIQSGLALSEPVEAAAGDYTGPTLFVPWGNQVSLFITSRSGMYTTTSGSVSSTDPDDAPNGYHDLVDTAVAGSVATSDVGQQVAWRHAVQAIESPSQFGGTFSGFTFLEGSVLAIRGYAGDPPAASTGELVTTDDLESQAELNVVQDFPYVGQFLPDSTAVDDWAAVVLARRGEERPLVRARVAASENALHQWLAYTTRIGDLLRVNMTGQTGLAFNGLYYVEHVQHLITDGNTKWVWVVDLSPAD